MSLSPQEVAQAMADPIKCMRKIDEEEDVDIESFHMGMVLGLCQQAPREGHPPEQVLKVIQTIAEDYFGQ